MKETFVMVSSTLDPEADYSREDEKTIQSRVSFDHGSDRAHEQDQMCTNGTDWFIYSDSRGLSRGSKD